MDQNKIRRWLVVLVLAAVLFVAQGCLQTESPAKGSLSGTVVDGAGRPLSAVLVSTPSASTWTDSAGAWTLVSLEPAFYTITAAREGYESQSRAVEAVSGQTVENIGFSLLEKGSIYNLQAVTVTSAGAVVSFNTRTMCITHLEYGPNALFEYKTPDTATMALYHSFTLSGLTPATTYHVTAVGVDSQGRTLRSGDMTFTTGTTARPNPPTGLTVGLEGTSGLVDVRWNADTGTDFAGYRLYAAEAEAGPWTPVSTSLLQENRWLDANRAAGQKLFYRVTKVAGTREESTPSPAVSFLVPGITTSSLVWTPDRGPYVLTGDLTIAAATELRILAGTEVRIEAADAWNIDPASDGKIELKVLGTLVIDGSAAQPVTFASNAPGPQPGDWIGITFAATSNLSASAITGLRLSFAQNGIRGERGLPRTVGACTITSCSASGIACREARQAVSVTGNTIDTCNIGIEIASNSQSVGIASNTINRCHYGIIARDNTSAEVLDNVVRYWTVTGIDLGNRNAVSIARGNLVAPGSSGTAVVLRGRDILRRNTLQGQVGVEITGEAQATVYSNLILADAARSSIGVLYRGNAVFSNLVQLISGNCVWNVTDGTLRYRGADGLALPVGGIDVVLAEIGLQGGNPFQELTGSGFSYVPSSDSQLENRGFGDEDIGAFDVP
ncbi:MAG TPA: carboxypeptidase regulatory-like domain-containing protein [Candidatus Ozemobacteraceae bacterium]|nr:carboxypeptidase regulatory-like domain-containing protein [Candidatus Ozemobacteraceae bacterium]